LDALNKYQAEKQGSPDQTLVWSHLRMGDVELALGNTLAAKKEYEIGHELAQRQAEADPKNAEAQRDLRASYGRLGDATLQSGDATAALEHYRNSLRISQRQAEADPGDARAQRDLSLSYNKLGDVTLRLGDTKTALEHYQNSLRIRQRRAKADPGDAQAQTDLFVSYFKLGSAEKDQHQYAHAAELFAKGRAVLLPWHEKKLLVGQFKNAVQIVDREIAACQSAEKALADLDFVFTQPAASIPGLLDIRIRALLKRKKPADAVASAERFAAWAEKQDKERDTQRYNAACDFALCAAASTAKEQDALLDRSLALLRQAKAAGYFNDPKLVSHIKQDRDFAGVRTHPAFVKFLAELEKPAGGG
jgi:tetratricopeptide (TPR) repeat protein